MVARKKRRATTRVQARAITGASLEVGMRCLVKLLCMYPVSHHIGKGLLATTDRATKHSKDASQVCCLQVLNKRRMEKPTERKASREAALR